MNQTTILLTRTILSAASQIGTISDNDPNFSTIAPYVVLFIGICFFAGCTFYRFSFSNLNHIPANNTNEEANSIPQGVPLAVINNQQHPARGRVTHITTPDMALPQPNPRFLDNFPLRDNTGNNPTSARGHDQSVDITGDDILDLTNHVRNLSRSTAHSADIVRPDSPTLPQSEGVDLTEVLSHLV